MILFYTIIAKFHPRALSKRHVFWEVHSSRWLIAVCWAFSQVCAFYNASMFPEIKSASLPVLPHSL